MKATSLVIALLIFTQNFCQNTSSTLRHLISKKQYQQLFPHHDTIYSYENFIAAANGFPSFANEGNTLQNKQELAAFFANIAHETTNGWQGAKGGPYAWGLVFKEEQACVNKPCPVYNTGGLSKYTPAAGKNYFGRGPIQISYAYNYGLAGDELQLPLLQQPELVASNGIIAFKTALWFWMKAQKPKPSCHDVMCGKWQANAEDSIQKRVPGFGMTILIINGGLECNTTDKAFIENRNERIGFYKYFAKLLGISTDTNCDCKGMGVY
ncbi:chitinase [Parasediminibacterium paludis]|uniref:Chitinase n=1 Tax=Parasediminibacterium paludis TaxID=908966 RepID=A0ABV8PZQ5_9BACT